LEVGGKGVSLRAMGMGTTVEEVDLALVAPGEIAAWAVSELSVMASQMLGWG
jgi:hypothetical protein